MISGIIKSYKPNIILIPSKNDLHKDHKIINYATRVAARPYLDSNKDIELMKSKLLPFEEKKASINLDLLSTK